MMRSMSHAPKASIASMAVARRFDMVVCWAVRLRGCVLAWA